MADANSISMPNGREGSFAPRVFIQCGEVFASSRDVANTFEKRHDNVVRDIDRLIAITKGRPQERLLKFEESFVEVETGNGTPRQFRAFNMNREAFSLLAMGFTGEKAVQWKLLYIEAFCMMEAELKRRGAMEPTAVPAVVEAPEIGESIREQRMALDMVREARILFGHGAARKMWREMAVLPEAASTDPFQWCGREPAAREADSGPAADWRGALEHLLQWAMPLPEAAGDNMERWIRAGAEVNGEWIRGRTPQEVRRALRVCGLVVEPRSGPHVIVANNHPWLAACYLETPWAYGLWRRALANAPGAQKIGATRFGGRHVSRGVRLPLALALTP